MVQGERECRTQEASWWEQKAMGWEEVQGKESEMKEVEVKADANQMDFLKRNIMAECVRPIMFRLVREQILKELKGPRGQAYLANEESLREESGGVSGCLVMPSMTEMECKVQKGGSEMAVISVLEEGNQKEINVTECDINEHGGSNANHIINEECGGHSRIHEKSGSAYEPIGDKGDESIRLQQENAQFEIQAEEGHVGCKVDYGLDVMRAHENWELKGERAEWVRQTC
ncbi:hypothetical protein PIB30_058050 [Stylosanthes scabra]|uniref:Uncharacterized protein n=1 Tax=Stylosanthes scabra TaxID=79078 RepID=A0ABU6XKJ7_9FABA|nr:hypothetical protein [Stylosanthes scabra]